MKSRRIFLAPSHPTAPRQHHTGLSAYRQLKHAVTLLPASPAGFCHCPVSPMMLSFLLLFFLRLAPILLKWANLQLFICAGKARFFPPVYFLPVSLLYYPHRTPLLVTKCVEVSLHTKEFSGHQWGALQF